ncbi:M20 family metallopeptidase [uncultured Cetobacterium sp.]|uniref:M20 metallopeptidase family protein n=1 Tax=uncultured Cetobacterium sp. TaxID=527638 RepID=UPI002609629A|nr:amidohydrolase [uncultured Cetobacterium sp.]
MKVKILAKKLKDDVIKWRREFHMYPEESLKEYETSKKILNELRNFGIQCEIIADTGVVATIHGYAPGKTVALRGDIDALAVIEKTNKEYSSKTHGLMHACGHDCHGAMLLVAAKLLFQLKNEFKGTIKLIFQPGEEIAKGAKKMIENSVLKDVDAILGIHVSSDLPTGTISYEAGPRLASADIFKINIFGEGGHGSRPDQCIDSVVVASAIVMNLQSVVSREFSPLEPTVLTVGSINS